MTAQASQTRIVNRALALLGSAQRVSSITEPSGAAVTALALFDDARDATLAEHPWNFAIRRSSLAANVTAPAFGYAYSFALPGDCLRWLPWAAQSDDFRRCEQEGGALLADTPGPLNIRYIARIEDVALWSAGFTEAVAWKLAAEMAEPITADAGVGNKMLQGWDTALRKAKRSDAMATGDRARDLSATSNWIGTRYSGGGTGEYGADWYYAPARGS